MSISDAYQTLAAPSEGEFKDRGSKFIAYAFPIMSELEAQKHLDVIKKLHPKARHHCFAYRLGLDSNNYRANDDGEPSGTAGRPILGQIDSFNLTNVFVIVVRYFGGTLLGTSGLINAYKLSTQNALENAQIIEKIVSDYFNMEFDYALMSDVMNALKKLQIEIVEQKFEDKGYLKIAIRKSEVAETLLKFKANVLKISLEEAATIEQISGVKLELM